MLCQASAHQESLHVHSLIQAGLATGGVRYALLSFQKSAYLF